MAANSGIVTVGKRISSQIWTRSSLVASSRRASHTSAYDKNPDEQAHPSHAVPEELIRSNSDKYWAPDPRTGVFGPATGPVSAAGGVQATTPSSGSEGSVLEQKAWFRPTSIEDLEKPAMP